MPFSHDLIIMDFDGTVIHCDSMIHYEQYYIQMTDDKVAKSNFLETMTYLRSKDADWKRANVMFYQGMENRNVMANNVVIDAWMADTIDYTDYSFFKQETMVMLEHFLRKHTNNMHVPLFVSGSYDLLLYKIIFNMMKAYDFRFPTIYKLMDLILCSMPDHKDGVYTGKLLGNPCIGEYKVEAVKNFVDRHKHTINPDWQTYGMAFGDDVSDLPMLDLCNRKWIIEGGRALDYVIQKGMAKQYPILTRHTFNGK